MYDLARSPERFDLVWFMGVLYHLRHPLLALDLLARRTVRAMVFQTFTMPGQRGAPLPEPTGCWEDERVEAELRAATGT